MRLRRPVPEPLPALATVQRMATMQRAATLQRAATGTSSGHGGPLIGELLLARGSLTVEDLDRALAEHAASGDRVGSVLVANGVVDELSVARAIGEQLGLPVVDLSRQAPAPAAETLLPGDLARGLGAVPLGMDGDGACLVAVADVAASTLEELGRAVGGPVRLSVAAPAQVRRALDRMYRALTDVEEQVAAFTATAGDRSVGIRRSDVDEVTADDAPVVRVVNLMLAQALRDRASDVHVEPQDARLRVRFRIDGALHEVLSLPVEMGPAVSSRIKIMAGMNIVERRRPQDGQIATSLDGREVDIRVATMGTVWGEKVVMRILDKSRSLLRLPDLGMPEATSEAYGRMIRSPYGMVICAGPTGSGKTTTLYASLTEVNGVDRNVMTVEDPVEYVFPTINQVQINETAGVTFATGLKSILRQDPDMILVGEIRDAETARIAVQSALTGHFVLSSLHATDSVSALYRFLDMGIEAFLVASSVIGVVGQRLVRTTCSYCRQPVTPTPEELAFYYEVGGAAKHQFWAGAGCHLCAGTGYSGRIGVYELLSVTEEMRELLVNPHPSHDEMRRLAAAQGLVPLREGGARLVEQDRTTIAEILRSIYLI
jgi:type IV pilus assembly protein PilB